MIDMIDAHMSSTARVGESLTPEQVRALPDIPELPRADVNQAPITACLIPLDDWQDLKSTAIDALERLEQLDKLFDAETSELHKCLDERDERIAKLERELEEAHNRYQAAIQSAKAETAYVLSQRITPRHLRAALKFGAAVFQARKQLLPDDMDSLLAHADWPSEDESDG